MSLRELSWLDRYVLHSLLVQNHQWWCAAGFQMGAHSGVGGYPSAVAWLEVAPYAERRQEILAALRRWAKRDGWEGHQLEFDEGAWSRVYRHRGMQELLTGKDHMSAIRTFLVEALEELAEMRREFPELPWPGK